MGAETTDRMAYFEGRRDAGKTLIFKSQAIPISENRPAICLIPPDRVVPIIFVPGIMGSNLKARQDIRDRDKRKVVAQDEPIWRVDGIGTLFPWLSKNQAEYQLRLRHDQVTVDDRGEIPTEGFLIFRSNHTPHAQLTVEEARSRGWGEVSAMFYLEFLDWLHHWLNSPAKDPTHDCADNSALTSLKHQHVGSHPMGTLRAHTGEPLSEQDIELLLHFDNPVYAFGYNWLQSNAESGLQLKRRIEEVIAHYQQRGNVCDQVILITHSMGGLVARAACKLHGAEAQVAGIFHGVMPTDGAAATYKRMVSGFAGEGGSLKDWLGANILGPRGDFTIPTLAMNTGPLELLPNKRYNASQPWLFIKDASGQVLQQLPEQDPYEDIYLQDRVWWRPCNEAWLNPAGLKDDVRFDKYAQLVSKAQAFHEDVQQQGDFHPNTHAHYAQDESAKAYGTVTWTLNATLTAQQCASLEREDPSDADMTIDLRHENLKLSAQLSAPDAPGDGVVPAEASARAVDRGVQVGHLLVRGTGYRHDESFSLNQPTEGPKAALQAIVRILRDAVSRQEAASDPGQKSRRST